MTPRWVVIAGVSPQVICSSESLADALRTVLALDAVATGLPTAVYLSDSEGCWPVLLVEDGIWRVTVPELLQPSHGTAERHPARAIGASSHASESAVNVVHAGSLVEVAYAR